MKKFLYSILFLMQTHWTTAQNNVNNQAESQSGLRADGKIWVVMTICITILIGLIIYLIRLDRKISRLEKQSP